jgi:tryptophan-rich sensory protein
MNWIRLLACLTVCQLAGLAGSVFTRQAVPAWYNGLQKPSFTPPNWLFGPAWISLYLLMAVAAYLVWQKGWSAAGVRTALAVFLLQLLLNALWSPVFFGLRSPLGGMIVIACLWLAIVLTMVLFRRLSPAAALLLAPYLLWVSYASALNVSIFMLNR